MLYLQHRTCTKDKLSVAVHKKIIVGFFVPKFKFMIGFHFFSITILLFFYILYFIFKWSHHGHEIRIYAYIKIYSNDQKSNYNIYWGLSHVNITVMKFKTSTLTTICYSILVSKISSKHDNSCYVCPNYTVSRIIKQKSRRIKIQFQWNYEHTSVQAF